MIRFAIPLVFVITPNLASAGDYTLREQAVSAFLHGVEQRSDGVVARASFTTAASRYDELWLHGEHDPVLALNRARSHRLAGDWPGAIAAYHEGLAIARSNRPLQQGLEEARNTIAYPHDGALARECRPRDRFTISKRMSPREAFLSAALLWSLTCMLIARWRMTHRTYVLGSALFCLLVLTSLGGFWWRDTQLRHQERDRPLVIVRESSALRRGNALAYPLRVEQKLPGGVEARLLAERGGWVQVELAGGVIGWLPQNTVLVLSERKGI